ncbi:hypothetical protein BGZ81_003178 [Podila clonocystis]|nr:hypothetical protein BGZ81_003178 [Podila clonocystis]
MNSILGFGADSEIKTQIRPALQILAIEAEEQCCMTGHNALRLVDHQARTVDDLGILQIRALGRASFFEHASKRLAKQEGRILDILRAPCAGKIQYTSNCVSGG